MEDPMMSTSFASFIVIVVVCGANHSALADDTEKIPLRVLYLSRGNADQRTEAFTQFFSKKFESCTAVPRDEFERSLLAGVDVVVLDWSQDERRSDRYPSPLGPVETWETPAVLLGSAGLLLAGPWSVIGGVG